MWQTPVTRRHFFATGEVIVTCLQSHLFYNCQCVKQMPTTICTNAMYSSRSFQSLTYTISPDAYYSQTSIFLTSANYYELFPSHNLPDFPANCSPRNYYDRTKRTDVIVNYFSVNAFLWAHICRENGTCPTFSTVIMKKRNCLGKQATSGLPSTSSI